MGSTDTNNKAAQNKTHNTRGKKDASAKPAVKIKWDHEKDNCGINPDDNPCGDANEY